METVTVHEAKTHLSRLLARVERGEEIIIARNRRAIARLVPLRPIRRKPGRLRGKIRIGKDFDAPLPREIEGPFRGEA
jgi:prevent-host-death family protein